MDRVVIGVDLGGTNLRTALLSTDGIVLDKRSVETRASEGWKGVVSRMVKCIAQQRETAIDRGLRVSAVGVGAPGIIQMEKGIVVKSPNFPDWNNLPLRDELEQALMVPVVIENDANAAALGEQWRGAGRGINSMIFLTLGTGVGGGIVLNNRIWQGADGMAGEVGHMTLVPEGRQCGCGNRGCLEMYASGRGIVQNYRELQQVAGKTQTVVTASEIYTAAQSGDPVARQAMKNMGHMLGIGLANLINIFNPQMIVLGGKIRDAWDLFISATHQEIMRRAFQVPAERTTIVPSVLGDDAGMVGAACVALQNANRA